MCVFTGIITHLGKLIRKDGPVFTFSVSQAFCKKISKGTSVAVNGVCLTVFKKNTKSSFSVEIIPETKNKTMLNYLKIGNLVNLELPATPTTFLSGHIIQGHIDTVAKLADIKVSGNSRILTFSIFPSFSKYLVEKGSIAVNGISLTIIKANKNNFTVGIISYTWKNTMLHTLKIGEAVNIEVDILAKYIERLVKNA